MTQPIVGIAITRLVIPVSIKKQGEQDMGNKAVSSTHPCPLHQGLSSSRQAPALVVFLSWFPSVIKYDVGVYAEETLSPCCFGHCLSQQSWAQQRHGREVVLHVRIPPWWTVHGLSAQLWLSSTLYALVSLPGSITQFQIYGNTADPGYTQSSAQTQTGTQTGYPTVL